MNLVECPFIFLLTSIYYYEIIIVVGEGQRTDEYAFFLFHLYSCLAVGMKEAVMFLTEIQNSQGYCKHHLVGMHGQQLFALSVLLSAMWSNQETLFHLQQVQRKLQTVPKLIWY